MKTFSWSRLAASRAKNEKKILEKKKELSCWGKKQQSTSNLHRVLNNNNSGRSLFGDDHDDEWQTRRANDDVGNHATAVAKNPVVVFNEHF